jgi:hypothetical protein
MDGVDEVPDGEAPAGVEYATLMNDESHTPFFCGSNLSRLDATLMFMNVCRTHRATNACINEMLHLLAKVILPMPNSLPSSEGSASSMLSRLGLKYHAIDSCKNGCVLFRHRYANMEACPMCLAPRYRTVGLSRVPHKVLRLFPLIPRLRRMFSTPHLASLMTWHGENISTDGKMRGPHDSPQWDHIRANHAEFERDSRNVSSCTFELQYTTVVDYKEFFYNDGTPDTRAGCRNRCQHRCIHGPLTGRASGAVGRRCSML